MPITATPHLGLSASVGDKGGVNRSSDVMIVQDALNAVPVAAGGQTTLLHLDGIAGPKTKHAIQKFQLHQFGWKIADGRVDPGGKTSGRLAELLQQNGGTRWNIVRVESATPNVPGTLTRNVDSADRLYEVSTPGGQVRVLYYVQTADQNIPRNPNLPKLRERQEQNPFMTPRPCSAFGLAGRVVQTAESYTPTNALIRLTLHPILFDTALHVTVRHTWIVPSSTPDVLKTIQGVFRFMRDDSYTGQKVAGSH